MNIPCNERKRSMEVNMLPMINIIFLLLVFVILTGGAVRPEHGPAEERETLVLMLDASGSMRLSGMSLSREQLLQRVPELRQPLEIRADEALPAPWLLELLQNLRAAGLEQVLLRAVRGP